jgi:MrfA Zn-binding domain
MTSPPLRVGELRPSQLLHTYGVGAVADLPNLSVVVAGLDDWDLSRSTIVQEDRLLAAVRAQLGAQVATLRTPPYVPETPDPFGDWATVGVPVRLFPRWLRCSDTRCNRLAPVESGLFELLPDRWRPERNRYVHGCRGHGGNRPTAVPARFVLACGRGHLDDFPWLYFVHGGAEPTDGEHTLRLSERGTTGEAANLIIECSCGARSSMAPAFGREAWKRLPACRGRNPHLGIFDGCGIETRTLGLGATNSWFAMQLRVFSLPLAESEVDQRVAENWGQLNLLPSLPEVQAKKLLPSLACWPDVEPYGVDAVWLAIRRRAEQEEEGPQGPEDLDLATPEWEAFTSPGPIELPDFTTKKERPPSTARSWLREVALVPRLREVSALYGFTRIDAPEWDILSTEQERIVRLARSDSPSWVPCAQTRGEGIFLRFDEDRLAAWEQRADVAERQRVLEAGHDRWRAARTLPPGQWPGARYVLLHTFAHVLIREFALECGYSASGIAERIYARRGERPMAGVLLYTAAPDSEGTLGGLVSLGRSDRLGALIEQALDAARLCTSDPLCAEHDPGEVGQLYGAACHACLFASETSCERGNHYLDRALLVDTVTGPGAGFLAR